ncbi:MAG: hypothetical protein AAF761_10490, partial [Pseudomonadota bacterium]
MTETLINLVLFAMLVVTAVAIAQTTRLFAAVMLSGVFSLLTAMLFVTLDCDQRDSRLQAEPQQDQQHTAAIGHACGVQPGPEIGKP